MNVESASEVVQFHRFLGERIQRGGDMPTLDEVLDEWFELHPEYDHDPEDDIAALQEAIDEIENGAEGMDHEEFMRQFCAEHNIRRVP